MIGADIDERYGTPEAGRVTARELFALPQVEVATHTYTHPYQWSFFENYDRKLEERLIGPDETAWNAVLGDRMRRLARRLFPGLARIGAETESKPVDEDPPRAFSDFPFDLDQEIRGAITAAEEMAPEGKHGTLYLWSGGAEPFEGAIARTRRLGLRNLNGGDSRYDADYPSISYLAPISRVAGAERQIYAANANDYLYITDGNGRDHGFLHLEATVNATEASAPAQADQRLLPHVRGRARRPARRRTSSSRHGAAGIADADRRLPLRRDRGRLLLDPNDCPGRFELADPQSRRAADRAVRRCRRSRRGFHAQRRRAGPTQEGNALYVALDEAHDEVIGRARSGYQRQQGSRRRRT